jgi:hypothetical protein
VQELPVDARAIARPCTPPRPQAHHVPPYDRCLVAERCWDRVRWAIEEYAWRFDGLRRPQSSRRAR